MDCRTPQKQQRVSPSTERHAAPARGVVVVYPCNKNCNPHSHEYLTHSALARRLAAIKDFDFSGTFEETCTYGGPVYFVPSDTLTPTRHAHEIGIRDEQHLFGGVVPYPFVATKTITHALTAEDAQAPEGWSHEFSRRVREAVLPGYSAFSLQDARYAGAQLLQCGAVRVKKPSGIGGLGQTVVADADELDACLHSLQHDDIAHEGVVLEQNLSKVVTQSVGQVCVGCWLISYCGTQHLTHNNRGQEVYGGSDLYVVRGDFDALQRHTHAEEVRTAIAQARTYHAAAMESFPGMFASRCNYDIAQGLDQEGRWRSGVLEQSWRIGGASAAEIVALEAFRADPSLETVRASTTEIYGEQPAIPVDASVYFCGVDAKVGPITKYARIEME